MQRPTIYAKLFAPMTVACALLSACGDDDAAANPSDGSPGATPVTLTGTVYSEGDAATRGPAIADAHLTLRSLDGAVVNETFTDGAGNFSIDGPSDSLMLLVTDPVDGFLGLARAQETKKGWQVYDIVLQSQAGVINVATQAGVAYDPAMGLVAVGFNPVNQAAGGEGADLPDVPHDPAFVLATGGVIVGNVLPPICPNTGTTACTDLVRSNNIFFPNVQAEWTTISPISPSGGSCALRFGVERWPVMPGIMTGADMDCR